jgi:hypothetical protein
MANYIVMTCVDESICEQNLGQNGAKRCAGIGDALGKLVVGIAPDAGESGLCEVSGDIWQKAAATLRLSHWCDPAECESERQN